MAYGDWTGTYSRAGSTPPLFHWAPRERREGIIRRGLRVGQRPTEWSHIAGTVHPTEFERALKEWRAPYTCFAEDPLWAWKLSGELRPEVDLWDLWWVWLGDGFRIRRIRYDGDEVVPSCWSEWRVFDDLPKSAVHWVAARPGGMRIRNNPPPEFP